MNLSYISILLMTAVLTTHTGQQLFLEAERQRNDSPSVIYREDCEGTSLFASAHNIETGPWEYALQQVPDPADKKGNVARFEIREDQPLVKNGKRSEVVIIKELPGKNMWYSFSVYFPSDGFIKDSQREVINQWYQDGSPATSLRTHNDRIILETGDEKENRRKIDIGALEKNTWQHFVFHFVHSHGSDGLVEVWLNGSKVISEKGGNMYDGTLPKWKIGIYKAAFKHGTSEVNKRVLFFDNIKVGNETATFEDMYQ